MREWVRRTRRYEVSDTEDTCGVTSQHWRRTHCSERVHGPWPLQVGHEPCESTAGPPQDPTLGPSGAAEASAGGRLSPVSPRTRRSRRAALPCSGRHTRDTHAPAPRNPGSSRVLRRGSCLMGTRTALLSVEAPAPKGVAEAPPAGTPPGPFPTPALLRSGTCPLCARQAEGAWPAASATPVGTEQLRTAPGAAWTPAPLGWMPAEGETETPAAAAKAPGPAEAGHSDGLASASGKEVRKDQGKHLAQK